MKYFRHIQPLFLSSSIRIVILFAFTTTGLLLTPTVFASSRQGKLFIDSTPSLAVYPSLLNEQNCQTSNSTTWTCVVTVQGYNLAHILVTWSAYTATSGISFSPTSGHLLTLIPTERVTISNIPCTNTSFLFSGQVYGGGGVIPATVPWSCQAQATPTPRPTPTPSPQPMSVPTLQPTPISTAQPSPIAKTLLPTPTPVVTVTPIPTPTIAISPTPILSSTSPKDPPINGNSSASVPEIFTMAGAIFAVLGVLIACIFFTIVLRRKFYKRS